MTMDKSWLIQRLQKPHGGMGVLKDNPFSFGGGLKNGGLRDEAMDLLRGIFSFDYMGAAEFEWGAAPKAFGQMAEAELTSAMVVAIDNEGEVFDIYLLCPTEFLDEAAKRVESWALSEPETKERVGLARALRPQTKYDTETCGWLELDNGFMFFTDIEMWEATCKLFGVET